MDKVFTISFLVAAVAAGAPLLFGTLGEILTEKSGNLNLGVEGMMYMGGVAGLAGAYYYEQAMGASASGAVAALIGTVCAFLCAMVGALIYSVLTITFRANQNVTGLALTIFGTGFGNLVGEAMGTAAGGFVAVSQNTKDVFVGGIPVLKDLPVVGQLLFSYNYLVYLGIILAIVMAWFLGRTRSGLNLRSVGEDPATADAAGVNVTLYRYLATCIGGGICGLGGMYIVMAEQNGVWVHNCVLGKGWIAVALVIFATWSPARALLGSLVFGALSILRLYLDFGGVRMIPIYDIIPYVATVVVLIAVSIRQRRESQPPASLGNAYFREDR
ncbi:MAG TPA: ABC transporter permease [Candidatus Flavonifractor merdipullorum]|uniref:ABC transporter permease n=1 Tax=Candidatus Flavonifractor merdipullorum TaxID=2838590 RepID=A0A9D1UNI0_9FIRM|nr:ABC transporter permease [Candidatus Flavonifractor merdipullorum]